jgi:hypothetical protein
MPNVRGVDPLTHQPFLGVAVKLQDGVLISFDGRCLRHCTSVCHPDGRMGPIGTGVAKQFDNQLFGHFTAAKEKIVDFARRKRSAKFVGGVASTSEDVLVSGHSREKRTTDYGKRNCCWYARSVADPWAANPQDTSC